MGYKAYGFRPPTEAVVTGASYAGFRMMSAVFGFSLALLFAHPGLLLWAVLFFGLGLMAEGLGRIAMQVAIGCSVLLIGVSLLGFTISGLIFGGITLALGVNELKNNFY